MYHHIVALTIGVVADWIIGDPKALPHPIRWIGSLIYLLTERLLGPLLKEDRNPANEKKKGLSLVLITCLISAVIPLLILTIAYLINFYVGIFTESVLTFYLLAAKSLYTESMKVSKALTNDGLDSARYAVSMIVGRDTECLDENGIIKAAVETVAENTSDGIIAPLLYTFIGGPVLGYLYKAINTMDSMVGYHNDKYENFGFYAARLDDIVNFIPSRISAALMILSAFVLGKNYSGRSAYRVFVRDRFNHKSPNSAQTESVCAGALRIRLAGDARYFGKVVKKPYIGDDIRPVDKDDIRRAGVLMFATEIMFMIVAYILVLGIGVMIKYSVFR